MSEFTPLLKRTIKFLVPQSREGVDDKGKPVIQHRQGECSGKVVLEVPLRRQVQIGEELHRYEDVTVLEVDGLPYAQFLASLAAADPNHPKPPAPVPLTRWNPLSKTVLNHDTGETHQEATDFMRHELGLKAPWNKGMLPEDFASPPRVLTEAQAALVAQCLTESAIENQKSKI